MKVRRESQPFGLEPMILTSFTAYEVGVLTQVPTRSKSAVGDVFQVIPIPNTGTTMVYFPVTKTYESLPLETDKYQGRRLYPKERVVFEGE